MIKKLIIIGLVLVFGVVAGGGSEVETLLPDGRGGDAGGADVEITNPR